jgi:hypothetical protein
MYMISNNVGLLCGRLNVCKIDTKHQVLMLCMYVCIYAECVKIDVSVRSLLTTAAGTIHISADKMKPQACEKAMVRHPQP